MTINQYDAKIKIYNAHQQNIPNKIELYIFDVFILNFIKKITHSCHFIYNH